MSNLAGTGTPYEADFLVATGAVECLGPDAEPILGVVALENMGVTIDPVTRALRRLHAKPLKASRLSGY